MIHCILINTSLRGLRCLSNPKLSVLKWEFSRFDTQRNKKEISDGKDSNTFLPFSLS